MRRMMRFVFGSMTATSSRVCTSARTWPDPASYCTLPAFAAERDRRDSPTASVEHGLDTAALVGDEDVALHRVVSESVRILACGRPGDDHVGLGVDCQCFARVRGRCEDTLELGH